MTAGDICGIAGYASLAKATKRKTTDVSPAELLSLCDELLVARKDSARLDWLEDHALHVSTDDNPWDADEENSLRDWIDRLIEEDDRERQITMEEKKAAGE
jgi:hypothetical protein